MRIIDIINLVCIMISGGCALFIVILQILMEREERKQKKAIDAMIKRRRELEQEKQTKTI